MSWFKVIKQMVLVGREAINPNIWLHRKATTRNVGRPMKSKPENLSTIPIQVPQDKFEEYYNFLAEFYADGRWEEIAQGSLQQGINNSQVKQVLKDFERGSIKVTRQYSDELDEAIEKRLENIIKLMRTTGELMKTGSRSRIREGRDLIRYADELERSYDRGR